MLARASAGAKLQISESRWPKRSDTWSIQTPPVSQPRRRLNIGSAGTYYQFYRDAGSSQTSHCAKERPRASVSLILCQIRLWSSGGFAQKIVWEGPLTPIATSHFTTCCERQRNRRRRCLPQSLLSKAGSRPLRPVIARSRRSTASDTWDTRNTACRRAFPRSGCSAR
jgi:hypothetical protein